MAYDERPEQFVLRASDARLWLSTARQLLTAASTLNDSLLGMLGQYEDAWREQKVGALRATLLLAGLAVENGLKALAVSRGVLTPSSGVLSLKGPFVNHDLSRIAADLDVFQDQSSVALLGRLTIAVQWAAKYPVPTRDTKMPSDGAALTMVPTDVAAASELINRIEHWLQAT